MTVAEQASAFIQENTDLVEGNNLFIGDLPKDPIDIVACYDRTGAPTDQYLGTRYPMIQILVRNKDYGKAYEIANEIFELLKIKYNFRLVNGGDFFYYCKSQSDIGYLGKNKQEATELSMNFRLYRRN